MGGWNVVIASLTIFGVLFGLGAWLWYLLKSPSKFD